MQRARALSAALATRSGRATPPREHVYNLYFGSIWAVTGCGLDLIRRHNHGEWDADGLKVLLPAADLVRLAGTKL